MSKRLQVLMPERELLEVQMIAQRDRMSVGEWVRRTLREACRQKSLRDPGIKLRAIRRASEFSFPTADIDQMLSEIDRGYKP